MERKKIEQMHGAVHKLVEIYSVRLSTLYFLPLSIDIECANAEEHILTYLPSPHTERQKKMYLCIRRLKFSDDITKNQMLPIHTILGAADYQRIKTTESSLLERNSNKDPRAEIMMFGLILAGKATDTNSETNKNFFSKNSQDEFERMCAMESQCISEAKGRRIPPRLQKEPSKSARWQVFNTITMENRLSYTPFK